MATLRITWKKSAIGYAEDQKQTIRSLGFKRLGQTRLHEDNRTVRGMIHKVRHLVDVQEEE
ncbi:MAG TPA: 50S ribosomal protein L30 [Dehalococcoidia bacterium]|jgi:large subunit ribosomal protein L30|nr:50S ribosomal protein L30 [Dehalococcoidia bacterium]